MMRNVHDDPYRVRVTSSRACWQGALLQRQAEAITKENRGRMVRAIGDSVMLEFAQAPDAAQAMIELHRRFPEAARTLGIEPLPVHSGHTSGRLLHRTTTICSE